MVRALALTVCLVLTACTVGPEYVRPAAPVPPLYKWEEGWREARPADALDRGAWWSVFEDSALDTLMRQVEISNQNVAAAEAAFRNAAEAVAAARAGFFPTVDVNASATRARAGISRGSGFGITDASGRLGNNFRAAGSASWIPDLWGSFRLNVSNTAATAQAGAADLAAARLAAQAQLAT